MLYRSLRFIGRPNTRDYDGEAEIENLASDEEWRLEVLTDRVWSAATLLYKRLTKTDVISEFNQKVSHVK